MDSDIITVSIPREQIHDTQQVKDLGILMAMQESTKRQLDHGVTLPESKRHKTDLNSTTDHVESKEHSIAETVMNPNLRNELEAVVKDCMQSFDASHDLSHVLRVRNMALIIAKEEGIGNLELVELAALLHDVNDHKYIKKDEENKRNNDRIHEILKKYNVSQQTLDAMKVIIDNMSFSKEIKLKQSQNEQEYTDYLALFISHPEMGCVQDADRLDAIGSIGIARTFCFGGSRGRSLFNAPISDEQDTEQWVQDGNCKDSTIGHFYEKLLILKDLMKTKSGQKKAAKRHEMMQSFLDSFHCEWTGSL